MRRAPFLPSLVAAVAVPSWVLISAVVSALLNGGDPSAAFTPLTLPLVVWVVALVLSFWVVAPITARLGFWPVVGRAVVAAAFLAVLTFPVNWALAASIVAQSGASSSGGLYDLVETTVPSAGDLALSAAGTSVSTGFLRLPLIVLAAVGSWLWQRRRSAHVEA